MKTTIRLAALIFVTVLLLILPAMAAEVVERGECGDNIMWVLTEDGTLNISGSGPMWDFHAPWSKYSDIVYRVYIKNGVTTIGEEAFAYMTNIHSLALPDSLTKIGNHAFFGCNKLEAVTIPDNVYFIGGQAFACCILLEKVVIPKGVTFIFENIFDNCESLSEIAVDPQNINYCSIDGVLFNKDGSRLLSYPPAKSDTKYTIPETVKEIVDLAFCDCDNLISVSLPNQIEYIGYSAFRNCSSLQELYLSEDNAYYSIDDSVLYDKDFRVLQFCPAGKSGKYCILDTTEIIAESAFSGCEFLTEIVIPDRVYVIGDSAFEYCYGLTSIVLPQNLTRIGWDAFFSCSSLSYVYIPDSVTLIDVSAFCNCVSLVDLDLPDNLQQIGASAFSLCSSLLTITIPEHVTCIEANAFNGASCLTQVYFEGEIPQYLNSNVFDGTAQNICIYYNKSVNGELSPIWMGYQTTGVFSAEELPETIISGSCNEFITWNLDKQGVLTISGCGDMPDYLFHQTPWDGYPVKEVRIGDGITSIGDYSFYCCELLETVNMPDSITVIGESAFYHCVKMDSIQLHEGIIVIRPRAFMECEQLTTVYLPNSLTDIYDPMTFENCKQLKSFSVSQDHPCYTVQDGVLFQDNGKTLLMFPEGKSGNYIVPNGVEKIGDSAFLSAYQLTSVDLPNSVTVIGASAFGECTRLQKIKIPNSIKIIEERAFYSCANLTSIDIPASVTEIGDGVFSYCSNLQSIQVDNDNSEYASCEGVLYSKGLTVLYQYPAGKSGSFTIPGDTKTIAPEAFMNCDSLTRIDLASVEKIDARAFWGCDNLVSVVIPPTVIHMEEYAFYFCGKLSSVTFENGLEHIGNSAFSFCEKLNTVSFSDSIQSIGNDAFSNCFKLTEITIPASINEIGDRAFAGCYMLENAYFLGNVPEIMGQSVFDNVLVSFKITYYDHTEGWSEPIWTAPDGTVFKTVIHGQEPFDLLGDINGDSTVDIRDAQLLFQYSMLPDLYPIDYSGNVDFNGDGMIDIRDAQRLFQYSMLPDLYPIS